MPDSAKAPSPGAACQGSIDLARLKRMPGFLLRLSQLRAYDAFHAELDGQNVTPARYSLLAVLHDNPGSRSGQIAEALRVKPPNMAALLAQLELEGLILRVPDPAERRASLVYLTEGGEALFARIDPAVHRLEAKLVEALSPAERKTLLAQLARLAGLG